MDILSLPFQLCQVVFLKEKMKNIKEAIELHIRTLAEDGLPLTGKKESHEKLISVTL
jgi:predicted RNase H-like HicB family nuclease